MSRKRDTNWLIEKSKSLFGDSFDYSMSKYIDAKTSITFRCKKHNSVFSQTSNNHFISKNPCKDCLREYMRNVNMDGLSSFKSKIETKFGHIYSFEKASYFNQNTDIHLICKKHCFDIIKKPQLLLNGLGCPFCLKEKRNIKLSFETLNEIKKFTEHLNGKCLSSKDINNKSKLDFECEAKHRFKKSWSEVKNSLRWCPKCSSNKLIGETLTRLILEHLLKIKLPSSYIKIMEGLQLDGYNFKRKIAFEYQGFQHFTESSHFHRDNTRYNSQLERDRYKKELCVKNGILLIEIFEFKTIRSGRIEIFVEQVKAKLDELKLSYSQVPFVLNLVELYSGKKSELYNRAKLIVEEKNGTLQKFIGSESKHTYTCSKGHEITNRVLGVIVKSNASYPHCEAIVMFESLKKTIELKGGKLIDEKLKSRGLSESYKWVCEKGHNRESKGQYLFNGFWCSECQIQNQRIELNSDDLDKLKNDATSGNYYQKDIPEKYGISSTVYRRIIKELQLVPRYLPQDRKSQKKKIKGKLLQINPKNLKVIKEFESLESVKHDESGFFIPEGIRSQMKKFRKAYGYYWCREDDYEETIRVIKFGDI